MGGFLLGRYPFCLLLRRLGSILEGKEACLDRLRSLLEEFRENGEVVGSERLELLKSWWGHNALSKKVDATSKFGYFKPYTSYSSSGVQHILP
jgi:hypothetical protein